MPMTVALLVRPADSMVTLSPISSFGSLGLRCTWVATFDDVLAAWAAIGCLAAWAAKFDVDGTAAWAAMDNDDLAAWAATDDLDGRVDFPKLLRRTPWLSVVLALCAGTHLNPRLRGLFEAVGALESLSAWAGRFS